MSEGVRAVLDLLSSREFDAIWEGAEKSPQTPASIANWPQPRGCTPAETWQLISAVRRKTAVVQMPFHWESPRVTRWYYLTKSMRADEAAIEYECRTGSELDSLIKSQDSAQFVALAHVDGALAAIREDGARIEAGRARRLVMGARRPRETEETVLVGCHRVIQSLQEFAEDECTPALIRQLNQELSQGMPQPNPTKPPMSVSGYAVPVSDPELALQLVSQIVNGANLPQGAHPIAGLAGIRVVFDACKPFGAWNATTAVIMGRLLLARSQLPVLSYVPVATLLRDWHEGRFAPPCVPVTEREAILDFGSERDHTLWMATMLGLVRRGIESTKASFQRVHLDQKLLIDAIHHDSRLNHRQRAVVFAALADHTASFTIGSHSRIHEVAYSTAHADLVTLERIGYLRSSKWSRALVFSPDPELRDHLHDLRPLPTPRSLTRPREPNSNAEG